MAIHPERLIKLIATAGRLVGLKELMRAGGFNPGEQTELKRILRDLVRAGEVHRDGKRFGMVGQVVTQKSGPAWQQKENRKSKGSGGAGAPARSSGAAEAPRAPQKLGGYALFNQKKPSRQERREGARAAGGHEKRAAAPEVPVQKFERPAKSASRATAAPGKRPANTVEGIIHHHRDGFGFVKLLVGKVDDVFVPPDEARKALDGDRVILEMVRGRDGRSAGKIVEVVGRTRQQVVGTYQESKTEAWVEPREAQLGVIRVPKTQLARPGDNVKVKLGIGQGLLGRNDELVGEVSGSLGSAADHSVEVLSIAYGKGFSDEFPDEVMTEADAIKLTVSEDEAGESGRRDLRKMQLVTIDGEDARDFDDAIFVEERAGGWRLVVAIADVSHYVREGTALNDEALRRATSVYMPGRVLPMLPERLSNGICSLKPDEDRMCMVADMQITRAGQTTGAEVYPAVMRSAARCTYTEVHQVLSGENVPTRNAFKPLFERANALALCLRKMRIERGAIDFDLPETRVELGEDGLPKQMVRRERWESHKLVEECMLAANEAVARYCRQNSLPTVNRFHGEPDDEKLAIFVQLLRAYGINVNSDALNSSELNGVLKQLDGHPEQRALNQLALRSMMQAVYSSGESGHYGLGATDYLHFTSPIRRYPDLLVHRLLKAFWARKSTNKGFNVEAETEKLEAMAAQSSERERAAMQVEREVTSLYACLLVKDKVGEQFMATITGLSEHGFYAELDDLLVDGFVKGESISPDFELDQATYRLVFGGGFQVKVGQKIEVKLISVNLSRKQIEYEVVNWLEAKAPIAPVKRKGRPGEEEVIPQKRSFKDQRSSRGGGRFDKKPDSRQQRSGSRDRPQQGGGKSQRFELRGSGAPVPVAPVRGSGGGSGAPFPKREELLARVSGQRVPAPAVTRPEPHRHYPPARPAPAAGAPAAEGSGGFDPRATLDRLWKQKVATPGQPSSNRGDDRRKQYKDNDPYAKNDKGSRRKR